MLSRTCPKCNERKDEDQFYQRTNGKYQPYCKSCSKTAAKEWRENHRERFKEIQLDFYHKNKKQLSEMSRIRYHEMRKDPVKVAEHRRKRLAKYVEQHGKEPRVRAPYVKRDVKNMNPEQLRKYWREKQYELYWRGRSPIYGKKPRSK